MENPASLLQAKTGESEEDMQNIVVPNNMNVNVSSMNFTNNMNNFGGMNGTSNQTTSSQCRKCQEIYTLLSSHILECHKNELNGNEKDNGSILNSILTSTLMLLTNKSDIQTRNDNSFDATLQESNLTNVSATFSLASSSNEIVSKSVPESVASQPLNPFISQNGPLYLQKPLKPVQSTADANSEQIKAEEHGRKTVLQGIPLLDQAMQAQGGIPLVLTNQLQPDGTRRPAVVPASCIAKTSEKSDLDVAEILVNKMPFPSVNKEDSSLAQLYFKQLTEGLTAGNVDLLRHTENVNQGSTNDRDLLAALLSMNNATGCPVVTAPAVDPSTRPVVETISQIVAAQKQLTNLLSYLGKKPVDPPLLPVAGLASQLVESPLNNPLFTNQHQRIATPGVLQIPLSSLLPASVLAQSSQGVLPANLNPSAASENAENTPVTFSNIFTRPPQPFQVCSAAGTITLPALALNSNLFQSSAVPVLQQPVKGSMHGSGQQTVLMPSGIQGSAITPQTKTLFSTSQSPQHFLSRNSNVPRSSQQPSNEQKSLFTSFPQSAASSLTEQLFQNSSNIPKLALTTMPSIFNLGNIPGISVLSAGLQSQSQSSLHSEASVRSIPLLPSSTVIVTSSSQNFIPSADKIQGLLSAAIQNPKKSTSTASITTSTLQKHENNMASKNRLSSLTSPREKMEADQSTVNTEPTKLYECGTCGTTFSVLSTLQQHEQIHLGTKLQCNYCNDVFSDAALYQEHISLHRGQENVHHCEYCNKLFTSRGELQKHLAEHTQKRPYKCNHCSKSFRDPGSLQKHERIHTGERPYKCKDCPRAFAEYSSLRKHNRVHTGEKPYKCSQCPKAFSISGNLQRHLYIHTGERPYRCTKCPKAFNNPSHLRRHVKNLHEGKKGFPSSPVKSDEDLDMTPIDTE